MVTVEELNEWLDGLSPHDLANYKRLLSLKKAYELIARMPEGVYKRMAIAGLGFRLAMQEVEIKLKKGKKKNA
jgi:hypothetical protein